MTITLSRETAGWMAHYSGEGSSEIVDLFGTDTIPTAFTNRATAHVVMAEIERLNPEAQVIARD